MLGNIIYVEINAPKEHQRVVRKITTGLDNLYTAGKISYEPFPETMIDEGDTSSTPDVLLYDNSSGQNVVIIEVSAAGAKKDFDKVTELVDDYEVSEGFVYNYKTKHWRKYKNGVGEVTDRPSFCDSIGYDLDMFLQ